MIDQNHQQAGSLAKARSSIIASRLHFSNDVNDALILRINLKLIFVQFVCQRERERERGKRNESSTFDLIEKIRYRIRYYFVFFRYYFFVTCNLTF